MPSAAQSPPTRYRSLHSIPPDPPEKPSQKRKLADKWSKEELSRFYKAYRKYGKNWRQIAGIIRSKSCGMVENLYHINKTFLSLPEDKGTADAFIAMMTDRHNIPDISDSEHENNVALKRTLKSKNRYLGKSPLDIVKDRDRSQHNGLHNLSNPSRHHAQKMKYYGDLLDHIKQHPVRKRTPRVPVYYFDNTDYKGAVGFDLVRGSFAYTIHDGGSPRASRALSRSCNIRSPHVLPSEKKNVESGPANTSYVDVGMDISFLDESSATREKKRLSSSDSEFDQNKDVREPGSRVDEDNLHSLADLALTLSEPTAAKLESSIHPMAQRGVLGTANRCNVPQRSGTHGKALSVENNNFKETEQKCPLTIKIPRKRRKYLQAEVSGEHGKTSSVGKIFPMPKRACLEQHIGLNARSNKDPTRPASPVSPLSSPAKTWNRRKMGLQKSIAQNKLKTSISVVDECLSKDSYSVHNEDSIIKRQLSNCLSSQNMRRWCRFEWFYSAVDYQWFAKNEFVNYLKYIRLGHVARLSRAEWSTIRSSLGKPRRFSRTFLLEERKKLENYRESVRICHAKLRSDDKYGLPIDLPQPLSIGQHVVARDPKTGGIHDGSILSVYHNRFEVQFANSDSGTQFVMDVDCMPLHPCENLPVDPRNQNGIVDELCDTRVDRNYPLASTEFPFTTVVSPIKIQANKDDSIALAEISSALDMKERLITELSHMNEVLRDNRENIIDEFGQFKRQYAMILSQLSEIEPQVESGRNYLRQRNSYHENSRGPGELSAHDTPLDYVSTCDLGQAFEIVGRSKHEARTMVAASLQVGESGDVFAKNGEALDPTGNQNPSTSSWTSESPRIHLKKSTTFNSQIVHAPNQKLDISSQTKELISNCLATCLMIQTCADEQHPPEVIEETLRHALAGLQPCCPENLPIYKDIQKSMTNIKYDMLIREPRIIAEVLV